MNKIYDLWMTTGFPEIGWQMVVMWAVVAVLLYLAIVKGFEPLLLVPISLGALIANLPIHDFILQHPHGDEPGGLFYYLNMGIKLQIFPPLKPVDGPTLRIPVKPLKFPLRMRVRVMLVSARPAESRSTLMVPPPSTVPMPP